MKDWGFRPDLKEPQNTCIYVTAYPIRQAYLCTEIRFFNKRHFYSLGYVNASGFRDERCGFKDGGALNRTSLTGNQYCDQEK